MKPVRCTANEYGQHAGHESSKLPYIRSGKDARATVVPARAQAVLEPQWDAGISVHRIIFNDLYSFVQNNPRTGFISRTLVISL
jgi:hypothetical protein